MSRSYKLQTEKKGLKRFQSCSIFYIKNRHTVTTKTYMLIADIYMDDFRLIFWFLLFLSSVKQNKKWIFWQLQKINNVNYCSNRYHQCTKKETMALFYVLTSMYELFMQHVILASIFQSRNITTNFMLNEVWMIFIDFHERARAISFQLPWRLNWGLWNCIS